MCMMSVVMQYGRDVASQSWTPETFKQFKQVATQVEALDEALGEPECVDPGKSEWMIEMERRMAALESARRIP